MPEMRFRVRWPDESVSSCYSPSLVVKEFLAVGRSYPVADFVGRSRQALTIASDRVRQKYGFACTGAAQQLEEIEHAAARFASQPAARVTVEGFDE
ncbi:MAG: transhydrogenase alpha subunit [Phycisphaerales bacterium]|nr:transhydrogenase alpha subunit [Phycisphaerales bacterium]